MFAYFQDFVYIWVAKTFKLMKKATYLLILCIACGITACVTFWGARCHYLSAFNPQLTIQQGEWSDSTGVKYSGEMLRGVPQGQGKLEYPDGSVYEGQFNNGIPHGHGRFSKPSGSWAEGEFCNDLANGKFKIHSQKQDRDFDTLLINTPLR